MANKWSYINNAKNSFITMRTERTKMMFSSYCMCVSVCQTLNATDSLDITLKILWKGGVAKVTWHPKFYDR